MALYWLRTPRANQFPGELFILKRSCVNDNNSGLKGHLVELARHAESIDLERPSRRFCYRCVNKTKQGARLLDRLV